MTGEPKNVRNEPLGQFIPTEKNPYYPGVFGWGIEAGGFRIVIYGPAEADHPKVNALLIRGEKFPENAQDGIEKPDRSKFIPEYVECLKAGDHPPCHVHVFDIKTRNETRFELVEHYINGKHYAKPLHLSDKHKNILTDNQIKAAMPILEPLIPDFIQCWREMYQQNGLSNYVSRIEKVGNQDMFETKKPDGSRIQYHEKSGTTIIIPPPLKPKNFAENQRSNNIHLSLNGREL